MLVSWSVRQAMVAFITHNTEINGNGTWTEKVTIK